MLQRHNADLKKEILACIQAAQVSGKKASLTEIQNGLIQKHGLSVKPALYDAIRKMGQSREVVCENIHPADVTLSLP